MKNQEVIDILTRLGQLMEIAGENPFKVRAHFKAAENIAALAEDIELLAGQGKLGEIPGVGKAIEEKIVEYLRTGKMHAYEEFAQRIPESVLELIDVPSVGPKKARLFWEQLHIKSVEELEQAIKAGKLQGLEGIKEKTIQNILDGISVMTAGQKRMTIAVAQEVARGFADPLKLLPDVERVETVGSLRRCKETIGDIDLLVISKNPGSVMECFVKLPQVKTIHAHGESKSSVLTKSGVQVDLRVVPAQVFGAAMLHLTGSQAFNVKIRQMAIKKNMKVSEYGVFKIQGVHEQLIACDTEEKCFKALGLPYIPPELREDIGDDRLWKNDKSLGPSIEENAALPELIEINQIKGDLHTHSTYSDGRNTIEEMVEAARAMGYEYLALCDHSEKLKVARGVSRELLIKKIEHIQKLNSTLKDFFILCGSEVEIDTEGNLDYNDDILSKLDFVIASVHSGFEQSKEKMTQRIVRACQNKNVHAIGHPFGRHIGKREPSDVDFKEVCRAAADTGTCLEINSFPIRLDLDSVSAYYARSQGVKFVINTDAHAREHLGYMPYGVGIARRAWLSAEDVINTYSLKQLKKFLKIKR